MGSATEQVIEDIEDFGEDVVDMVVEPIIAPTKAALDAGEGVIDIAKGDVSEGVGKIVNAPGEAYMGATEPFVTLLDDFGLGDIGRTAQKYGPVVASLYAGSTGNFWTTGAAPAAAASPEALGMEAAADASVSGAAEGLVTGADSSVSLAEGTAGVRTGGEEFLFSGDAPGVMDAGATVGQGGGQVAGVGDAGAFDQWGSRVSGEPFADVMGVSGQPAASKGVISGAMDFAKENPLLAFGAMSVGAGAVSGVGQYMVQKELQKDRIAAEKEMQAKKLEDAQALEEWKRRFTQAGSYFDARIPVRPRPGAVLRRPDGSPVYGGGGVISSTMG